MGLKNEIRIMEVCGTHTEVIAKHGIGKLFLGKVTLISGPGCPVCVIPAKEIDQVIEYAVNDNIIVSFGDIMRIPGSKSSLSYEKSRGKDIRAVYSPLNALTIAKDNPAKQVIFVGVGFETTAPLIALTIMKAKKVGIKNFSVLSLHRTMPYVLEKLFEGGTNINGLLLPGHVCTIVGAKPFEFITHKYGITAVVSGFNPEDVVESIQTIINNTLKPIFNIQYKKAVNINGNPVAKRVIDEVFKPCDASWRGFGLIKDSGLEIKQEWSFYDARERFGNLNTKRRTEGMDFLEKDCCCGEIMRGLKTPFECPLFKSKCNPQNPKGPSMVTQEGSCAINYKWGLTRECGRNSSWWRGKAD